MTSTAASDERWEKRFRYLPFAVLALASIIAIGSGAWTGWTSPAERLIAQLSLLAVTIGWLAWGLGSRPRGRAGVVYYIGRTGLALALTVVNPLFCIYAWIGYIDADEHFRGRAVWGAIGVTAVTMAFGQAGGLPMDSPGQVGLFGMLILVNFGLAGVMGHWSADVARTSEERAEAITELEQALAENKALHETVVAQARAAGVQEERQRLAGEIHDTIAQSLAGIVAQLQAAHDDPAGESRRIERATELARDALAEARRSVHALAPVELSETDLPAAVTDLVRAWERQETAKADVVVTGTVRPLHPEVEATILRVTQESLANVAKHADATRVGVTLSYEDDEVIVDVRDDGVGFDHVRRPAETSFGLRGMRQRAERLAGALEVESATPGGTAVSLRLPALAQGAA